MTMSTLERPETTTSDTATTVRVRCNGSYHSISIIDGAMVLHDHTDILAERAMIALGGEAPRCLVILQAWRTHEQRSVLPSALHPLFDEARAKSQERAASASTIDPYTLPLLERVDRKIKPLARKAMLKCKYRRSRSQWAGGDHSVNVSVGPDSAVSGHSTKAWSSNGKWGGTDSVIDVTVQRMWLYKVYRRGLAVADGIFVFEILNKDAEGFIVRAGRQKRGFDVKIAEARIVRGEKGKPHFVSWL
jgi:hypothetical protein